MSDLTNAAEALKAAQQLRSYFHSIQGVKSDPSFQLKVMSTMTRLLEHITPEVEQFIRERLQINRALNLNDGINERVTQGVVERDLWYAYLVPALDCLCYLLERGTPLSSNGLREVNNGLRTLRWYRSEHPELGS